MKIYIGIVDDDRDGNKLMRNTVRLKIGYTDQTCWARCKKTDYQIFGARSLSLTDAETLFIESYVRLGFNAMTETQGQLRTDYFYFNTKTLGITHASLDEVIEWGNKWLSIFVQEAIEIINAKRHFSNTAPISERSVYEYSGLVWPYTY